MGNGGRATWEGEKEGPRDAATLAQRVEALTTRLRTLRTTCRNITMQVKRELPELAGVEHHNRSNSPVDKTANVRLRYNPPAKLLVARSRYYGIPLQARECIENYWRFTLMKNEMNKRKVAIMVRLAGDIDAAAKRAATDSNRTLSGLIETLVRDGLRRDGYLPKPDDRAN